MGSYHSCLRSTGDCLQFVYNESADEADAGLPDAFRKAGIRYAYVDYLDAAKSDEHLANILGNAIKLPNLPYHEPTSRFHVPIWTPFLDDLVMLSRELAGIAVIIDNADAFLAEDSRTMFKLIEAFTIPFDDWLLKNKPYHLCFQMEKNPLIKKIFAT
jgi:hypothetical protein